MSLSSSPASEPVEAFPERRTFFQWLTYGLGGVAAAALAIPCVGYCLGALRKRRVKWESLGAVTKFPLNETRLVTFVNPLRQPWDGMAANTGVYVRYLGKD